MFRSPAGLRILVGRNNRQNDKLTTREADKRDIWLHTQKIHGSHVILCTRRRRAPDAQSLLEAAQLAAYFSQGRESANVPVDYTPVKFVKSPRAAPGMVIYTTYQTLYVTPDEQLAQRLASK